MKKGFITIDSEKCKGCYLCVQACPKNVLTISPIANTTGTFFATIKKDNQESCIACGSCFQICPDTAIEVFELEENDSKKANDE